MALLFFLSSQTEFVPVSTGWDKLVHLGAYGVLGLLALRACHGGTDGLKPWPTLLAVLMTLGYGAVDELHQGRVAGRDASVLDWLADAGGALLAVACLGLLGALRARWGRRDSLRNAEKNG